MASLTMGVGGPVNLAKDRTNLGPSKLGFYAFNCENIMIVVLKEKHLFLCGVIVTVLLK